MPENSFPAARQKRPFFIIGHRANTIADAKTFLDKGTNALEIDIVHDNKRFYVSHDIHKSYENIPTLEEFLPELKTLLADGGYDLSLMIWDMKCTDFDPNRFMAIVRKNFSGNPCDGIAMLITHPEDHGFINQYTADYENVGVGLDESDIPPSDLEKIFKTRDQKNYSYADGITTFLNKTEVFKNITEAQTCRYHHEPDSYSIIYTWVLHREEAMRTFLGTYIDGIMVDPGGVELLKQLVTSPPFNEAYELASNGYNPFAKAVIPQYLLTVETSDKFLAGTDAKMLFTLTGSSGISLQSLPYNSGADSRLERGNTTLLTLEGMDLGAIKSLTVEVLTDGLGSGWLPRVITVESKMLEHKLQFVFNDNGTEEWIKKKAGPVTKLPS
ncbi:MAG: PLAT/LH2 domain-containing protein [Bacteroidota bacterium]